MSPLLAFYLGSHGDHRGRFLAEIVEQDDVWLEVTHDYIQWMFPLTEASRVRPDAPTLSKADIEAFKADDLLRRHMLIALDRMLRFYGLRRTGSAIDKGSNWSERKDNWFTQSTHNDLRITRILKSLRLLGLHDVARQFADALRILAATERDSGVSPVALRFWSDAVA